MVSGIGLIRVIHEKLIQYKAEHIVVDPVMVSTSGSDLLAKEALDSMKQYLLPLAQVITPNIPETEKLTGMRIRDREAMEQAAKTLEKQYGCSVLVKGGHSLEDASDCLCQNGKIRWFEGKRIVNDNTHGTGCTLSSAIAAWLAKGAGLEEAVEKAKDYISGALAYGMDLGKGSGPLNHGFLLEKE